MPIKSKLTICYDKIKIKIIFLFVKKKKSRLGVLRQKRRFQTKLVTWLIF